jgi:regulator of RNase E activity RraA
MSKSAKPSSAEVHPGPGFRIRLDHPRVDPAITTRFLNFDVPDISDTLNRLYALDTSITSMNQVAKPLCGSVCTVRTFPGDNLMVHKALDIAQPGDVVMIDAQGDRTINAVLGDTICTKASHRGIAGFIVDGLVRDMPAIEELGFSVYARGTTAVGPLHRGPGEINYPISCGGVVVNPGDVVVADAAGIVVIPRDHVLNILERLEAHRTRMATYLAAVQRGEFSNDWVDQLLEEGGCPVEVKTAPET